MNDTPLLTPVLGGEYGLSYWSIIKGLPLSSFVVGPGVIYGTLSSLSLFMMVAVVWVSSWGRF